MTETPHKAYPIMTPAEYKEFQKECLSGRKLGRISGFVNLKIEIDGVIKYILTRYEFHI